ACDVKNFRGLLALDDRCEWHELGTFRPGVEQIMRFAARRICENCACAQSAWAEFHAVGVDRADLAGLQTACSLFDGSVGEADDAGRAIKIGVDAAGKITPQVKVAEIATLLGPAHKTVALQQPGEGAADRQPVVSHGGEYENLVEVERL